MKILSADQIRELDALTIENRRIESIELMEHAGRVFFNWLMKKSKPEYKEWFIFAGPGNNGGDALATARMLSNAGFTVHVFSCTIAKRSKDCQVNYERLFEMTGPDLNIQELKPGDHLPEIKLGVPIIDGIFGSGINRPVEGYWGKLIQHLNSSGAEIYSIDIPSGLQMDEKSSGAIIQASYTLSFEFPKLAFMIPENAGYIGRWDVLSIGLDQAATEKMSTNSFFLDAEMLHGKILKRKKFDHKGVYGHALIIAGSQGKMGAAILAVKASLRSGIGKVTVHLPTHALDIMQVAVPEAMVECDIHTDHIEDMQLKAEYDAIGLGPGLGISGDTQEALQRFISTINQPIVIDADGLNILALHKHILEELPSESILTPHLKEFENLFGKSETHFKRLELLRQVAIQYKLNIVLKGANTAISDPQGNIYFNSTGNPGMATAGSGDVLLGVITGLLAQGYPPLEACQFGVYLHGLAGDLAVKEMGEEALIASDIIEYLGIAFLDLHRQSIKGL